MAGNDCVVFPNVMTDTEILEAARSDLGEDTKHLKECMEHLRKWIDQSPHLQNIKKDDFVLKAFLRGCKYSLEKSKEKLDFFFTVRTTLPAWFENWDPRQGFGSAKLQYKCISVFLFSLSNSEILNLEALLVNFSL